MSVQELNRREREEIEGKKKKLASVKRHASKATGATATEGNLSSQISSPDGMMMSPSSSAFLGGLSSSLGSSVGSPLTTTSSVSTTTTTSFSATPVSALSPSSILPSGGGATGGGNNSTGSDAIVDDVPTMEEIGQQEGIYKIRLKLLKKEETDLQNRLELLKREKDLFIKEIRRIRAEDQSRFSQGSLTFQHRYVLLELIGKGGFSEVHKAYDLLECRTVAVKIHQHNSQWSEERKANYLRHVLREMEIHKKIQHDRIVRLYDAFEIHEQIMVTVLEFCKGEDLDHYLKSNHTLKEDEARSIIGQVFAALRYLSEQFPDQKIIHYDLKPANILFSSGGEIKITDFGLSKILHSEEEASHMELTSQGAGTYWYLPPECFELEDPMISAKVDIWSAGVILFQMLFGRRPFGHEKSQQSILNEQVILNEARQVRFPDQPRVSPEAKDFIRLCLTYDARVRPDVHSLCRHPFLSK